ncbi:MAG TPA: YkgJ family cysteine cluster protein [Methanospirillum sp.]|nr:YkgJ family cysteine cluster protein [Methanospirillum sp.]
MADPYIERELIRLSTELGLLRKFPEDELAAIIRDVGFTCTGCGGCCTTSQNGHVFLLEEDTARAAIICPDALIPAPLFELCDRNGVFYVSGYALRAHPDGSCIHLVSGRCRIYQERFSICRVYPYMLHREPDERGKMAFRQISGLNEHGEYHHPMTSEESIDLAKDTMRYEEGWLEQMIGFYTVAQALFEGAGTRHVRKIYDKRMYEFYKGLPITVMVYQRGTFTAHTVTIQDYAGIIPGL